jgi:hypothetical protein
MPGRLPKVIALRVQTLRGGTLSVPGSALVGGCT